MAKTDNVKLYNLQESIGKFIESTQQLFDTVNNLSAEKDAEISDRISVIYNDIKEFNKVNKTEYENKLVPILTKLLDTIDFYTASATLDRETKILVLEKMYTEIKELHFINKKEILSTPFNLTGLDGEVVASPSYFNGKAIIMKSETNTYTLVTRYKSIDISTIINKLPNSEIEKIRMVAIHGYGSRTICVTSEVAYILDGDKLYSINLDVTIKNYSYIFDAPADYTNSTTFEFVIMGEDGKLYSNNNSFDLVNATEGNSPSTTSASSSVLDVGINYNKFNDGDPVTIDMDNTKLLYSRVMMVMYTKYTYIVDVKNKSVLGFVPSDGESKYLGGSISSIVKTNGPDDILEVDLNLYTDEYNVKRVFSSKLVGNNPEVIDTTDLSNSRYVKYQETDKFKIHDYEFDGEYGLLYGGPKNAPVIKIVSKGSIVDRNANDVLNSADISGDIKFACFAGDAIDKTVHVIDSGKAYKWENLALALNDFFNLSFSARDYEQPEYFTDQDSPKAFKMFDKYAPDIKNIRIENLIDDAIVHIRRGERNHQVMTSSDEVDTYILLRDNYLDVNSCAAVYKIGVSITIKEYLSNSHPVTKNNWMGYTNYELVNIPNYSANATVIIGVNELQEFTSSLYLMNGSVIDTEIDIKHTAVLINNKPYLRIRIDDIRFKTLPCKIGDEIVNVDVDLISDNLDVRCTLGANIQNVLPLLNIEDDSDVIANYRNKNTDSIVEVNLNKADTVDFSGRMEVIETLKICDDREYHIKDLGNFTETELSNPKVSQIHGEVELGNLINLQSVLRKALKEKNMHGLGILDATFILKSRPLDGKVLNEIRLHKTIGQDSFVVKLDDKAPLMRNFNTGDELDIGIADKGNVSAMEIEKFRVHKILGDVQGTLYFEVRNSIGNSKNKFLETDKSIFILK